MKNIEIFHITTTIHQNLAPYQQILETYPNDITSILIDNYHFKHSIELIPQAILNNIDLIGYEKSFTNIAEQILNLIPTETQNNKVFLKNTNIILKKHDRYTCPLLTSAWYLTRLGIFEYPKDTIIKKNEPTDELLNILNESFINNEKKVMTIIEYYNPEIILNKKIKYIFYNDQGVLNESV